MSIKQLQNKNWKNYFEYRHVLNMSLAVAIVCVFNLYFSFSGGFWLTLSTFFICLVTPSSPLRRNMVCFAILIIAIIFSILLKQTFQSNEIFYAGISLIFLICYFALYHYQSSQNISLFIILFFVVFLISILTEQTSLIFLQNRMLDVTIGAILGMLFQHLIFPIKLDAEFSHGIVPVLKSLNEYSSALTQYLFSPLAYETELLIQKNKIENSLQVNPGNYPEWVFDLGFNRGLRSGLRYFLISLERITEIFFSLYSISHHLSHVKDSDLLNTLQDDIKNAIHKNEEILIFLLEYFENKKMLELKSDFTSDIIQLENSLQTILPANIEMLDISPIYLLLTALVRDIKDLRELLLQLMMSLPST